MQTLSRRRHCPGHTPGSLRKGSDQEGAVQQKDRWQNGRWSMGAGRAQGSIEGWKQCLSRNQNGGRGRCLGETDRRHRGRRIRGKIWHVGARAVVTRLRRGAVGRSLALDADGATLVRGRVHVQAGGKRSSRHQAREDQERGEKDGETTMTSHTFTLTVAPYILFQQVSSGFIPECGAMPSSWSQFQACSGKGPEWRKGLAGRAGTGVTAAPPWTSGDLQLVRRPSRCRPIRGVSWKKWNALGRWCVSIDEDSIPAGNGRTER